MLLTSLSTKLGNVKHTTKVQSKCGSLIEIEMQTPVNDFGIFLRYREKYPSFSLVLIGAPRKEALARAKLLVG
jgi:hypothetical protein